MTGTLQRITSEYIDSEDRVRLRGALSSDGDAVVLWLTRRLLDRIVPHLVDWLGQQPEAVAPLATEQAGSAAPVIVSTDVQSCLVDRIDVSFAPGALTLTFFGPPPAHFALVLSPLTLRQWLEILLRQYRQADWPEMAWMHFINSIPHDKDANLSLTLH